MPETQTHESAVHVPVEMIEEIDQIDVHVDDSVDAEAMDQAGTAQGLTGGEVELKALDALRQARQATQHNLTSTQERGTWLADFHGYDRGTQTAQRLPISDATRDRGEKAVEEAGEYAYRTTKEAYSQRVQEPEDKEQ